MANTTPISIGSMLPSPTHRPISTQQPTVPILTISSAGGNNAPPIVASAIANSGAIPGAAIQIAQAMSEPAKKTLFQRYVTNPEMEALIKTKQNPSGVIKTLKDVYNFTDTVSLKQKFPTYPQFVNALTTDQRKRFEALKIDVPKPFHIPDPSSLPEYSYSNNDRTAGIPLTNEQFAKVLNRMQQKGMSLANAIKKLPPHDLPNVIPTNDKDLCRAVSNCLTPLGREMMAKESPENAYPMQFGRREINDTVVHQGTLQNRKVVQLRQTWKKDWDSKLGRIALLILTVFSGIGLLTLFSESVRNFHSDTFKGVSTQDPQYEAITDNRARGEKYLNKIGYNPDDTATIDAAWAESVSRQPNAQKIPAVDTQFKIGVRYQTNQNDQFIYAGEGQVLFAPQGDAARVTPLQLHDPKTGKPIENGRPLLGAIASVAGSFKQLVGNGNTHFTIDRVKKTVTSHQALGDEGEKVKVPRSAWKPGLKKKPAADKPFSGGAAAAASATGGKASSSKASAKSATVNSRPHRSGKSKTASSKSFRPIPVSSSDKPMTQLEIDQASLLSTYNLTLSELGSSQTEFLRGPANQNQRYKWLGNMNTQLAAIAQRKNNDDKSDY